MLKTLALTAAFALLATGASAQKIDANGKCHDAKGKFAKMEVCKGASAAAAAKPAAASAAKPAAAQAAASGYKLDAKGRCHDAKGKMAKKEMCKA